MDDKSLPSETNHNRNFDDFLLAAHLPVLHYEINGKKT
jgi:hypothetical protein